MWPLYCLNQGLDYINPKNAFITFCTSSMVTLSLQLKNDFLNKPLGSALLTLICPPLSLKISPPVWGQIGCLHLFLISFMTSSFDLVSASSMERCNILEILSR